MTNVFLYGTLMHPDVWSRVTTGTYDAEPGVLHGYSRFRLRGLTYPGLVEDPDGRVEGIIRRDVAGEDLERLDRFEGHEYARRRVDVTCGVEGALACDTYILREACRERLSTEAWDLDWFQRQGLERFLHEYRGWKT